MYTKIFFLIFLIFLSGVFSAAEIALTSLSEAKVKAISKDKKFGSRAIRKLKSRPQRFLITILIGNNLVNVSATAIATAWAIEVFGNTALGVITGLLTFIILIFGEISPKTLAQKYSEKFARVLSYPILWLTVILFPVIWIFEKFTQFLINSLHIGKPLSSVSEAELLAMVDIGTREGVIEEQEQEFIENVLEFSDTTVDEIMTVKKDIEILNIDSSVYEAVDFFLKYSHSRIPVYKDTINNIIGIVTVRDILRFLHDTEKREKLSDFKIKHPIIVPKTKSISKLFHEFQRRHQHLAIVVDEHGETIGLVTMEDILEEIVGDIVDEHDREDVLVKKISNNQWEARGEADIEEINETLSVELDFPEHETISLLILEQLHRFPKLGEKIIYGNLILQVKEMSKQKIEIILITKLQRSSSGDDEDVLS